MPVNSSEEEAEIKEGKDLFVKCKRIKYSVSIVQPQQGVEVSDMENKVSDALLHNVSVGKDPMNMLTDAVLQSTSDANGCSKGHVGGTLFAGNESARSKLLKICSASGWKEPLYDFEEQGSPHNKLFTCKVTVHVEGISDTVLECLGDPKSLKEAAQEHAAGGAVWCLAHYGHVK